MNTELKYNPEGYLWSEMQPKHHEVVWFVPYEGAAWRMGKAEACGIAETFEKDYPVERYRGCLKFPSWISVHKWKYPSLEEVDEFNERLKLAYGK